MAYEGERDGDSIIRMNGLSHGLEEWSIVMGLKKHRVDFCWDIKVECLVSSIPTYKFIDSWTSF